MTWAAFREVFQFAGAAAGLLILLLQGWKMWGDIQDRRERRAKERAAELKDAGYNEWLNAVLEQLRAQQGVGGFTRIPTVSVSPRHAEFMRRAIREGELSDRSTMSELEVGFP